MKTILQNTAIFLKQSTSIWVRQNLSFSKKNLKYVHLICCMFMFTSFLFAQKQTKEEKQKDEKFTPEEAKQHCASLPTEKRARIRVVSAKVTTSTTASDDRKNSNNARQQNALSTLSSIFNKNPQPQQQVEEKPTLGPNMASMLTQGLYQLNCYRVLQETQDKKDLENEIDQGQDKYSSKKAPKAGKRLGAQIIAKIEVTEYSSKSKNSTIMGVGKSKNTVKLGFILEFVNAETSDIIASHQFRIQSTTGNKMNVMGIYSKGDEDPDVAAVMEDGVNKALGYCVFWRDSLNITEDGNFVGNGNSDGTHETEVDLTNANYTTYTAFATTLQGLSSYKSMEKTLSSGTGTYTLTYSGTFDKLMDELGKKVGAKYDIVTADKDKIEIKVK